MIEQPPKIETREDFLKVINVMATPECIPILKKISDEYLYWDKVKYLAPKGVDPIVLWYAVKLQRQAVMQRLSFGKYTFCFMLTPIMQSLLHELDMNMGGSLSAEGVISDKDKQVYLTGSIMEEAIASSQMEGASTTRKVAKDMLRKQLKPQNKSQRMIVNNYQTIRQLVERKNEPLTRDLLLEVHSAITSQTLVNAEDEGRIRETDDIFVVDAMTGDVAHTPPTHTEIEEMLQDLFTFANGQYGDTFIHPIVKGIILHFMLAWIHPFVDGNGRTSRSLVYWYLLKSGYWMTEYLSVSRVIYNSKKRYEKMFLYTESDEMDMSYFILYNLRTMKQAYIDLKSYLARKLEERNSLLLFGNEEGINERQMMILKLVTDTPTMVLIAQEIAVRFGISARTARTDLNLLADMGKLKRVAINKKLMGYIKPEDQ